MKLNLPVILLRGLIILPNNDLRLEFDNDESRNIIDESMMFHDNKLLIVTQLNRLEETPNINDLPSIGVVANISHKLDLPNGKTRVIIKGLYRANVIEYLNLNSNTALESIVTIPTIKDIDEKEEILLVKKVQKELEIYVKNIPYIGNSILAETTNANKLDKLIDIVAPNLPITIDRMFEYLKEFNPINRSNMLLEDIYKDKENYKVEKEIDSKVKKEIDNSQKEYLLREKLKTIKEELGEISNDNDGVKSRINKLDAPKYIIDRLNKEYSRLENLPSVSPEIGTIKTYIDWLLDLPWNKLTNDNDDLNDVLIKLNETHNGLLKVKTRIIEYLAVKKNNNNINSPIICLVGPPGVGKTSLAFSIASALNRNFVKISVGGVNDEAEILGHRKTYLGANPGRIIQSLKKAKSSNPVFLIDEIDKMTKDIKGDPASALLSILDPEQNKLFSDNYIEEEYDLSKIMFITTANNKNDIPEALKDRLEIIDIPGYTEYEKLDIAQNHLLKKICKSHGIEDMNIQDDIILKIIELYTKEAGVRELERLLSTIIRKEVTNKVLFNKKIKKNIKEKDILLYLGKPKYKEYNKDINTYGIVNGLAYTNYGGDVLQIETNYYKGEGKILLTGSLGEVMKESAYISLSYIKANCNLFKIDYDLIIKNDIHIHALEGAVPKDGPSAGVSLTTSIISSLKGITVPRDIAMTGEISLHGNILPIGGLKEKSLGAYRNGIKKIFIPNDNINDLDEINKEIRDEIEYIPVKNYKEIYKYLFK